MGTSGESQGGGKTILVADDDATIRGAIAEFLNAHGYAARQAGNCTEVLRSVEKQAPDAAVLDFRLPDGDALEILDRLRNLPVHFPIVILTGYGSIELAVRAVQRGASNFLTKPLNLSTLLVELQRLTNDLPGGRPKPPLDPFAGTSRAIAELEARTRRMLGSSRPLLLLGETGSGKGTLARWIHANGPRGAAPLISLNCAALSPTLLESELFGHERGAFSGAVTSKPGLIEAAHGGTLLLDEIGDMSMEVQPKLLTVLEEQRFHRLGSVKERSVDIRLIAATHRNLIELADRNEFRRDLYFRISTVPLHLPSLRERAEDIPALVDQLLTGLAAELGEDELRVSDEGLAKLSAHSWPGNIRELRNVLERAALLTGKRTLVADALQFAYHGDTSAEPDRPSDGPSRSLADVEREHIERTLRQYDGSVSRAAEALDMPRSTLYARLRKYSQS